MNQTSYEKFDFAIIGAGGAGLSALVHLHRNGAIKNKRVVIIEPDAKTAHDRTWSFWERGEGPFEALVFHRWSSIGVHNEKTSGRYELAPLSYKLIRSSDFYEYCHQLIAKLPNVSWVKGRAENVNPVEGGVEFTVGDRCFISKWAFSSLPHPLKHTEVPQPYLDQHFRGWFIKTEHPAFDPDHATLMDFRTEQEGETRFFYVLPFSAREAMVEIAIFSNNLRTTKEYDQLISEYLKTSWPQTGNWQITHTEQGIIPMTTYPYPTNDGHLIYIGLGGGYARPSTGYTFYNLQVRLKEMARSFAKTNRPGNLQRWPSRHLLYDATLLSILEKNKIAGADVFPGLFASNPTSRVLDFLNGETNLLDEVRLMSTTDMLTFGKTFTEQVFVR